MFLGIDPLYFIIIAPALLLGLWAQFRVRSAYAAATQVPANLTGAAAARYVLDSAGLSNVDIEMVPGELTDHYDPRHRVLRLSQQVYAGRTQAAVGIAAHEAGHAIQHARNYAPLVVRNAAVPVAGIGSNAGILLAILGAIFSMQPLMTLGILLFGSVVFFQLVNLPVEFDASARAKGQLVELGIVPATQIQHVNRVLNAAAWTYVAATLQAILTLIWLIMRFGNNRD